MHFLTYRDSKRNQTKEKSVDDKDFSLVRICVNEWCTTVGEIVDLFIKLHLNLFSNFSGEHVNIKTCVLHVNIKTCMLFNQ